MHPDPPLFTLHVLGDPVLRGPDGPVRGRAAYKRRVALLAILALARGRPVGRERLVGLLWPELPGDGARHVLSETLYVLRKELGEDALVPVGNDVAINPARIASDVGRFLDALDGGRAEEAVGWYGGPLLDGFYVADAPEFERWVDGERDRLARAAGRALESLAEAAEREGAAPAAAEWWQRLLAMDPYSSRVALRLVRCLESAGERGRALRAADAHAALLRAELEVEPDGELLDFVERLRAEPPRRPARPPRPEPAAPVSPADEDGTTGEGDAEAVDAASPPVSADPSASLTARSEVASGDGRTDVGGDAGRSAASPSPADAPVAVVSPASPSSSPTGETTGGRPRRRRVAFAAAAVAVLGAAAWGGWTAARAPEEPEAPRYDPRRIAVLYFDDHTPDGGLGYLASGLTEMLLHDLSQVEALDVVSRNGVKPFRDHPVRFDSLVSLLRVGSVVEGSVQRSGDSVRVTVQLIDAATQAHLESRVIVHPISELFALEDTLAGEVAAILRRRLGEEVRMRARRAETRSDRALSLYLQAEEVREVARRLTAERDPTDAAGAVPALVRADSFLAAARAADPAWARPALVRGWVALDRTMATGDRAFVSVALAHADSVLAADPGSAGAMELRGAALFTRVLTARGGDPSADLAAAERSLRGAVTAAPGEASAWARLSQLLRVRGQLAEADLAARRALREDAYLQDADAVMHQLFSSALMRGDLADAAATCGQGARRFPGDWRFRECRLTLLREDRAATPDPALAWRLVEEIERMDPPARARAEGRGYSPVYRRAIAAAVLARAGRNDSARAVLARARTMVGADAELRLALAYDEAYVRLLLGERDEGMRLLDELVRARPALGPFLERDPLFRGMLTRQPGAASGTPAATPP